MFLTEHGVNKCEYIYVEMCCVILMNFIRDAHTHSAKFP